MTKLQINRRAFDQCVAEYFTINNDVSKSSYACRAFINSTCEKPYRYWDLKFLPKHGPVFPLPIGEKLRRQVEIEWNIAQNSCVEEAYYLAWYEKIWYEKI